MASTGSVRMTKARLSTVRGRESGFATRVHSARLRCNRATAAIAAVTVALIVTLGGFIFYNTNVLNEYITDNEMTELRADYEQLTPSERLEQAAELSKVATQLAMGAET